ncbi:NUDIX hydrolase [Corynebacterium yudongzhengii]|uniref:NUDIX hydrolase n=1 Tax=Corynebacterium yudongzhengii TaxID=2080740 RepID=A0A2U1T4K5_9CORY|nr:NUDIX hydrolase [Corynebacterium yudongzhengii]AWB82874.1 NUDIX hydrolase [Corynebacterium yudongzhengii]PWC00931.1 NUDIX hydrolase [Corynebacterium yudongzhengii]
MTDNASTPSSQRRRKRRRSRRRGQSGAGKPSAGKQTAEQSRKDSEQAESSSESSRRRKRGGRNRRGGRKRRGRGPNAEQSSSSSAKRGGRRRRGGAASHRKKARSPQRQHARESRMETRDETSAGGLVLSGLAESVDKHGTVNLSTIYVALIGRLDRRGRLLWSMPKGHVEKNEDRAATAEREVWEETGVTGEVISELGVIDYWFVSEGVRIHKTVHHFLLRYADGDLNDEDPEVTEVAWVPVTTLIEHLAYADERKLARQALDQLEELARKEFSEGKATPR